ncbi:MAG TPA: DUF1043 family protein [Burkholderiaceae bacterium]|nr:DUF1043 family protein [Burkholderiaceae bacterium]
MTAETAWLLAILAVVIAAAIGFFAGRRSGAGTARIAELESEVRRQQDQSDEYRKEVAAHFDKTATLFVSMAGSYKQMFEHLSSGYEKLSPGSARETLQQRVDVLLVGDGREDVDDQAVATGIGIAAGAAAATATAAVGPDGSARRDASAGSGNSSASGDPVDTGAGPVTPVGTAKSEADPMAAVGIVDSDTDRETVSETPAGTTATLTTDETPTRTVVDSEEVRAEPLMPASQSSEATGEVPLASDPAPESPSDEARRDALAPAGDPLAEEAVGDDRSPSRDGTK